MSKRHAGFFGGMDDLRGVVGKAGDEQAVVGPDLDLLLPTQTPDIVYQLRPPPHGGDRIEEIGGEREGATHGHDMNDFGLAEKMNRFL